MAENHTPVPMAEIEKADAERWQAIDQLLTPQQRTQYAQIQQRFEDRMQGLDQGNRARVARPRSRPGNCSRPRSGKNTNGSWPGRRMISST